MGMRVLPADGFERSGSAYLHEGAIRNGAQFSCIYHTPHSHETISQDLSSHQCSELVSLISYRVGESLILLYMQTSLCSLSSALLMDHFDVSQSINLSVGCAFGNKSLAGMQPKAPLSGKLEWDLIERRNCRYAWEALNPSSSQVVSGDYHWVDP